MSNSGFLYYYDLLGLGREDYRLHYTFEENSGLKIVNYATNTEISGLLSSSGSFHSVSGKGFFQGQNVSIQNASGLSSDDWTHIFINDKSGQNNKGGILFDSLSTGIITSGYRLGLNDANKLYFESFDSQGNAVRTSRVIYGTKNCAAIVKNNDVLSFYCFDFNQQALLSDSFIIEGNRTLFSDRCLIGDKIGGALPYSGYLDEYIYISRGLNPSSLKYLVSGLFSDYTVVPGPVTSFNTTGITGYQNVLTGVTGIVSYSNAITGSGVDAFGTITYQYQTQANTGYLVSGYLVQALTGVSVNYLTGDSSFSLSFNQAATSGFGLNEISYIRKIFDTDLSYHSTPTGLGSVLNLRGGYDSVEGEFQLEDTFEENQIQVYLNGVSQIGTGYAITGDFYVSGISLSGDYAIDGFYARSSLFYNNNDTFLYDNLSGNKQKTLVTGVASGASQFITGLSGDLIFFNGQLLIPNLDYSLDITGGFVWKDEKYQGASGALTLFPAIGGELQKTGVFIGQCPDFPRNNSRLFLNGQRQLINNDYLENSSLDLVGQSGLFEKTLDSIYNNTQDFFF